MRLFHLERTEDPSGVSGTGIVAQGVVFDDGRGAMTWLSPMKMTTTFDHISEVEKVNGHGGKTKVVWEDQRCPDCHLRSLESDPVASSGR